jgi:hypothetical protein
MKQSNEVLVEKLRYLNFLEKEIEAILAVPHSEKVLLAPIIIMKGYTPVAMEYGRAYLRKSRQAIEFLVNEMLEYSHRHSYLLRLANTVADIAKVMPLADEVQFRREAIREAVGMTPGAVRPK